MLKRKKKLKANYSSVWLWHFAKGQNTRKSGIPTTMSPNILLRTYRLLVKKNNNNVNVQERKKLF